MELPVVTDETTKRPWYAEGLKFTCAQCGNCCTGGPGFVWISTEEIRRLAEYLKLSPEQVVEKYCRKIDGQFSLKERRNNGQYDCIFLREQKVERSVPGADKMTAVTMRTCTVYPVRPLQCRTWPFWPENLKNKTAWALAAKRCHGMNHGRAFSQEQVEAIRDATDWPQKPPTSME